MASERVSMMVTNLAALAILFLVPITKTDALNITADSLTNITQETSTISSAGTTRIEDLSSAAVESSSTSEKTPDAAVNISTNSSRQTSTVVSVGTVTTDSLNSTTVESSTAHFVSPSPDAEGENEYLLVPSETMVSCLSEYSELQYEARSGLFEFQANGQTSVVYGYCYVDVTVPSDQIVKVQIEDISGECACEGSEEFSLYVRDGGNRENIHTSGGCPDDEDDVPYYTYTNRMAFWVEVDLTLTCSFRMNFTAVSATERPQLELVYTSDSRGYVQTPGWDQNADYPINMDSWVQVDVPKAHVVMVSLESIGVGVYYYECRYDTVTLFMGGNSSSHEVWTGCRTFQPLPSVHDTEVIFIRFKSDMSGSGKGFRLRFSFHHQNSAPEKLVNGVWNCSVPYFDDFKQHLLCDLDPQCLNLEDESECPYTTEVCGIGRVSIGDGCYTLIRYQKTFQWSDETIAYFMNAKTYTNNDCGVFRPSDGSIDGRAVLFMNHCSWEMQGNILCEFDPKSTSESPTVRLPQPGLWTANVTTVTCPAGHVTHTFLACDVKTSCWKRDYGTSGACAAPLTPLPPMMTCADGIEQVPYTLVCDHRKDCRDGSDEDFCTYRQCQFIGQFQCGDEQCVPLNSRCDGQEQCANGGDEKQCVARLQFGSKILRGRLPPAVLDLDGEGSFTLVTLTPNSSCPETHFRCPDRGSDGYCLPVYVRCNGVYDCPGREDEAGCDSYTCSGFYRCRASRVCLHSQHMCDGIFQCPNHDDELLCPPDTAARHRNSDTAILSQNFGHCPEECVCHGLAAFCAAKFPTHDYPDLRFLDATGSGLSLKNMTHLQMLVYLSLAQCGLTKLDDIKLPNLQQLDLSDNFLTTVTVSFLLNFQNLKHLILSGNPILKLFPDNSVRLETPSAQLGVDPFSLPASSTLTSGGHSQAEWVKTTPPSAQVSGETSGDTLVYVERPQVHKAIRTIDLSRVPLERIDSGHFSAFPNLESLNLSDAGVEIAGGEVFSSLTKLQRLDVRGCPLTQFPRGLLTSLNELETVQASNYKLCCPAVLPAGFNLLQCQAPADAVSSCDALLRDDTYRIYLSVLCCLALTCNATGFIYRVFLKKSATQRGCSVFLTHIHLSDFLKGVYLTMIAVADRLFYGNFLWNDVAWRKSAACQMAGFLWLWSTEVSVFLIFFITVDRVLALFCPLPSLQFGRWSANLVSCVVWVVGLVLACVPLLPGAENWEYYSQTALCTPLLVPVSSKIAPRSLKAPLSNFAGNWGDTSAGEDSLGGSSFAGNFTATSSSFEGNSQTNTGEEVTFGVLIVVNLLVFLLIATGQAFIYWSFRSNSMAPQQSSSKSKDLTIARRFFTVVLSDFLCWFPVGLLGLVAAQDVAIPGQVSVAMAIVVLPLNSALNPFLYTVNMLLERRRHKAEQMMEKRVLMKLKHSHTISSNVTSK